MHEYVENATGGDPEVMVHMTLFRVVPWEQDACRRLPSAAEKKSYKRYVRKFAGAIDDTYAAIVLQPDGPFALCAPGGSPVLSGLVEYAALQLGALPHASVYIDIGSAGWNHHDPANAVKQLVRGGEHVRGFHLNTTHYEATKDEIGFGTTVVRALEDRGITGKHFTVDAANGRPFTWRYWHDHPKGQPFDNTKPARRTPRSGASPWASRRPPRSPRSAGGSRPDPPAGTPVRRRLPVGGPPLADDADPAVQHGAGAQPDAYDAILSRLSRGR